MTSEERQGEIDYYAGQNGESLNYRDISEKLEGLRVPSGNPSMS